MFGISPANADALVAAMNARTNITARLTRALRRAPRRLFGEDQSPLLTMHTIIDGLVPVSHESLRQTVADAGRLDRLFQTYTTGSLIGLQPGTSATATSRPRNCSRRSRVVDNWVRTGVRPTAASFPAGQGFAPNFMPPAFPQP